MSKKDKISEKTKKRKKLTEEVVKKKKVKPPKIVAIDLDNPDELEIEIPKQRSKIKPSLNFILGTISPDGNVEVKMDWNQEFLNQIRDRGFSASREEEAIMSFLNWMFIVRLSDTPDAAVDNVMPNELREALKQHATTGELIT